MKNAQEIKNNIIKTRNSKGDEIDIIQTIITYEDGTIETFKTIDKIIRIEPFKYLAQLKDRIGNYEDFKDNFLTWKREGKYVENDISLRYIDSESMFETEDIVQCQKVKISQYDSEDGNVVLVTLTTAAGEVDTFACQSDELNDILTNKVDNYKELKKKSLIDFEEFEEIDDTYSIKSEDYIEENDEILGIDYFVGNNLSEDYAIVTVRNGSKQLEKKISIEAIGNIISVNDIDHDLINYYKIDSINNNEKIKIKERKFYKIYNSHIASNEKTDSNANKSTVKKSKKSKKGYKQNKKKREISRIVFYTYTSKDKEKTRAVLFYNDRSTLDVSKNEAIIETEKIAKKNKIKLEDYETELFDSGFIKVTNYEELYKNRNKYLMAARREIPSLTKKDNIFKRIWNKVKGNDIAKRIIASITAVVALVTGGALIGKKIDKHDINPKTSQIQNDSKNIISNNTDNNTINNNTINNDVTYTNSYDILNSLKNRNDDRYNYLSNIKDTLYNYNTQEATKYQESEKDTKLAHTFDELAVQYLIYNDISGEELTNIFGNEIIDQEDLMSSFEKAAQQDGLAHNIQTENIAKTTLLKTKEAEDFYNKYNDLFTKMNNCELKVKKQEYIKNFYDMLRKDFPDMKNGNYSNVKGYQLSILEFVESMDNMNITVDNKLNNEELQYISGLKDEVKERIGQIVITQNARALVNPKFGEIDTLPQTESYEDILIAELEDTNSYYSTEANRDITNYASYQEHVNGKGDLTKKDSNGTNKTTNTPSNSSSNENNGNKYNNNENNYDNNENNYGNGSDKVTGPYEPHDIVVEDDENFDEHEEPKNDVIPEEDREIADEDPNNQVLTEEDMEVADDDDSKSQIIIEDEEDNEQYYTPDTADEDNSLSLDDFTPASEDKVSSDTIINYDENATDNNGALSDNYTDETTVEPNNAVTPDTALPDPNNETASNYQSLSNEELADMIVESWANHPTDNGTSVTYTMHL